MVTDFSILPEEAFSGAPEYAYDSTIRVNISNVDRAKEWLQSLMKHSKCTYRHSKGRKPGLKRVLYKVEMHCQHKRKPLTPLQLQQKANARVKSSRKVLMHDLRQKKTECPSCLKFTVVIPTKKDQHRALDHPYEDRKESIASIRSLVYAENAMQLVDRYNSLLRSGTAKKNPKFISYVSGHWRNGQFVSGNTFW